MAQEVFFAWQADDLTWDLNRHLLGFFDPGVYRGYYVDLSLVVNPGLLVMTMADPAGVNNAVETEQNLTVSAPFGVLFTKQGGIVREDADLSLPVTDNSGSADPRIDTVYCEHEYTQVTGGTAAIYGIIEGAPATNPVAPGLTNAPIQVIIGYIRWEAEATGLGSQTTWIPAGSPSFAGNTDVMCLSKNQESTGNKIFDSISGLIANNSLDSSTTLVIPYQTNYIKLVEGTPTAAAKVIDSISETGVAMPVGSPMYIVATNQAYIFTNTTNFPNAPRTVKAGESFILIKTGSTQWTFLKGGEALRGAQNKFFGTQSFNRAAVDETTNITGHVTKLTRDANTYDLNPGVGGYLTTNGIKSFNSLAVSEGNDANGGTMVVVFIGNTVKILNNQSGLPAGQKKVLTMSGLDTAVVNGGMIIMVESANSWDIISQFDANSTFDNLKLSLLKDVVISSLADENIVVWDSSTSKWKNAAIPTYVQDRQNVFTKTQTFGSSLVTLAFTSPGAGNFTLVGNGITNQFLLDFGSTGSTYTGANINDLQAIFTGPTVAFPTNTIVTINTKIIWSGAPPIWGANFDMSYVPYNLKKASSAANDLVLTNIQDGCTYTFLKTATKWVCLSMGTYTLAIANKKIADALVPGPFQTLAAIGGTVGPNTSSVANLLLKKDPLGMVHFSGFIGIGGGYTNPQDIITLPVGWRPANTESYVCSNLSYNAFYGITIGPAGDVTGPTAISSSSGLWVSGIKFTTTA